MLDLVFALLAGIVTIAAPCTLPVLPILLGASVGQSGKIRPAMIALGFVVSFSAVALALSALTRAFDFDPTVLRSGAAILLLGFGLVMVWPTPFQQLSSRVGAPFGTGVPAGLARGESIIGGFVLVAGQELIIDQLDRAIGHSPGRPPRARSEPRFASLSRWRRPISIATGFWCAKRR